MDGIPIIVGSIRLTVDDRTSEFLINMHAVLTGSQVSCVHDRSFQQFVVIMRNVTAVY